MAEQKRKALVMHRYDNVATALQELHPGDTVTIPSKEGCCSVELQEYVAFGHKLATTAIPQGAPVIKYGEGIGVATVDIGVGQHVHIHNVTSRRGSNSTVSQTGDPSP